MGDEVKNTKKVFIDAWDALDDYFEEKRSDTIRKEKKLNFNFLNYISIKELIASIRVSFFGEPFNSSDLTLSAKI